MVKHASLCLAFVVAASPAAFAQGSPVKRVHHVAPAHKLAVAPADEYFGRMKMSILGIRNQLKDLGARAESHPEIAESIFGAANFAEDAMRDWERKYPNDSWLPKTVFALERMYCKVPTDQGRARAKHAMAWLLAKYPRTSFAAIGRNELAAGTVGAPVGTAAVNVPAGSPVAVSNAETMQQSVAPVAAPASSGYDSIAAPAAGTPVSDPDAVPSYATPAVAR